MTQAEKILRHLKEYGNITPMEALQEYGIMRLASRITDLKKAGHIIVTNTVSGYNRFGEKVHYASYSLEKEE
jgi:hypothetical protein